MKTMKLWRKVLLQALFYFCSFMAIIWLLNMVFSDGIDDWKGEIIKGSLYTVTIIIFNNWKEIKEHICELLDFRDYLSDDELKLLGDLQDCDFFYSINLIIPATDTPDVRKQIAEKLWKAIEIARKL